ncbi:MAG: DUF2213 domain-containing protein [Janthinobacterium lividum]
MLTSFTDTVQIGEPRVTRGGYMVVDARAARTGIQTYHGHELSRPDLGTVRVYRPESEVFDKDALASFAHVPVTNDHPATSVDAGNWRDHAVGYTGDTIVRDGDHVRIPFMLMDQATIDKVKAGKRELSAGYTGDVVFGDGVTPEGEPYDATLATIRGNHLAIVSRGRAGASCRIGDAWPTDPTPSQHKDARDMPDNLRTLLVDGISISITDQGAQAVEKLQRMLTDAETRISAKDGQMAALNATHAGAVAAAHGELAALTAAHAATVTAKDGEMAALGRTHDAALAAKDGEIAALAARIPDTAVMDALVDQRAAVTAAARRMLGDSFDPKGKTEAEMRRAVVTARLGDAAVAGRQDEFFAAAFDTLALADVAAPADPLRGIIADGVVPAAALNDRKPASPAYEHRMSNRWKGSK